MSYKYYFYVPYLHVKTQMSQNGAAGKGHPGPPPQQFYHLHPQLLVVENGRLVALLDHFALCMRQWRGTGPRVESITINCLCVR